jgi:pimeloyl-ACP methyl ester carboxylesterase
MASETGAEAFIRQQQAIIGRPGSRPDLARVDCPTLVLVGDTDQLTPHPSGRSRSPAASRGRAWSWWPARGT